jgi:hypothetical protein
MDVLRGRARGGEGGGDLARHVARFAHAGDDHPAAGGGDALDRRDEEVAQAVAEGIHEDGEAVPLGR